MSKVIAGEELIEGDMVYVEDGVARKTPNNDWQKEWAEEFEPWIHREGSEAFIKSLLDKREAEVRTQEARWFEQAFKDEIAKWTAHGKIPAEREYWLRAMEHSQMLAAARAEHLAQLSNNGGEQ